MKLNIPKTTLRDLRKLAGKTCAEVAEVLRVSERTVFRYEQGKRTVGIEQIIPLADLYEVFITDIVEAQLNTLIIAKSD